MSKSITIATIAAAAFAASAGVNSTVTFDNGHEGWSVNGNQTIIDIGGANGNVMHQYQFDGFFQEIRNSTNATYLGDWTAKGALIEISADIRVNTLRSPFNPSNIYPREVVLEFRDYDNPATTYPWASVWALSPELMDSTVDGFVTHTWLVDTTALGLPIGWGGTGAEDPNTFEPILPAGTSYTEVLQNVDEMVFTTAVPGYFYGFTEWDFEVDNISVRTVPAPASMALVAGVLFAGRRRRQA